MMTKPKVTLYFDVLSPFGYLAYYVLRHFPVFKSCEIKYLPISLGALMKACDNRPPLEIKNKSTWTTRELFRWAHLFNIPLAPPSTFPFPTHDIQCVLAALQTTAPDSLPTALDAIYASIWANTPTTINNNKDSTPTSIETITPLLAKALSKDLAAKVVELGPAQAAKELLRRNTDQAFERGAFGLPWLECVNATTGEQEGFWGFDHLGVVVRFLGLGRGDQDGGAVGLEVGGTGTGTGKGLAEGMRVLL